MLDGVFNHASRGFYQFNHTLENGPASPYLDWFTFRTFPLYAYDDASPAGYQAWWNLKALPKFNHANPQVREFLFRVAEYWIEQGIDQIPPDLVVKSQRIDIIDVNVWLS